jgi:hypothetical protein
LRALIPQAGMLSAHPRETMSLNQREAHLRFTAQDV